MNKCLVTMKRSVFDSINDEELGWACMQPVMHPLRGKDPAVKLQVYSQLTPGQQALFMFYAFHNHAINSLDEFYWWSAYYLAQPGLWSEFKAGLQFLDDTAMLRLLGEIEMVFQARNHPKDLQGFDASPADLDGDTELYDVMNQLNAHFHEISPLSRKQIAVHIRNNPEDFVEFEA